MTARPLPNWARNVIDALADAIIHGHNELTENEQHLINATSLLLRSRFDLTSLGADAARDVIKGALRTVLRDLDGQEGAS